MVVTAENFYQIIDKFDVLDQKIDSIEADTFRRVFSCQKASETKNILYIYRAQSPIPRLKGESDIVYIGQTKRTLKQRYFDHADILASSKANRLKFEHILSKYGSIQISISPFNYFGDSLLSAEGQLLWWYFQNHCEYPPINYTQTKIRNDAVNISFF